MSSALAQAGLTLENFDEPRAALTGGAQTLLALPRTPPSLLTQAIALLLYAMLLTAAFLYAARPTPSPEEDAVELVMLPPAVPEEALAPIEQPPPIEEALPEKVEEAPPPIAEEPAVAPVPPKAKPKPKAVEHKPPVEQPRHAPQAAGPARPGQANAPPNALASSYANQVHARIARAAAAFIPRAALARHESGRVGYRILISPSGAVISQSISRSGNAAFDTAAAQALARAAPFPATGMTRPAALSGAIVFR